MLSAAKIWAVIHTIFCLGLNHLIPFIRKSRWAKYILIFAVINEIRGAYFVFKFVQAWWERVAVPFLAEHLGLAFEFYLWPYGGAPA